MFSEFAEVSSATWGVIGRVAAGRRRGVCRFQGQEALDGAYAGQWRSVHCTFYGAFLYHAV